MARYQKFLSRGGFAQVADRPDHLSKLEIYESLRNDRPEAEGAYFESEYRRAVLRVLDSVVLLGVDISGPNRRQRLSIAYVTLSVKRESEPSFKSIAVEDGYDEPTVSVNEVLAKSQRIIVQGQAGSGKTTLLKWIAVQSALQNFDKELLGWNNSVPFFIRLRECTDSHLPAPEEFPRMIASPIGATMPKAWVNQQLHHKRAALLVDGIDEVSTDKRQAVRDWLEGLLLAYPDIRVVVTSRSPAVTEESWLHWFHRHEFTRAELLPMDLPSVFTFIEHWHSAVSKELIVSLLGVVNVWYR